MIETKYVRTKEGLFEVKSEDETAYWIWQRKESSLGLLPISKKRVLSHSNEIYWLLNRIIFFPKSGMKTVYTKLKFEKMSITQILKRIKSGELIVYGAVWTDDSLKFVAKLNEKGDWELYESKS